MKNKNSFVLILCLIMLTFILSGCFGEIAEDNSSDIVKEQLLGTWNKNGTKIMFKDEDNYFQIDFATGFSCYGNYEISDGRIDLEYTSSGNQNSVNYIEYTIDGDTVTFGGLLENASHSK